MKQEESGKKLYGGVTLRSFSSEMEACLAQSKLASEGIAATVHRFSRYRAMAKGGWLLKVDAQSLGRARGILRHLDREIDMDEYVDVDDDSYRRCPVCHSVNVVVKPLERCMAIWAALSLGVLLLFLERDWSCRKCGHAWCSR